MHISEYSDEQWSKAIRFAIDTDQALDTYRQEIEWKYGADASDETKRNAAVALTFLRSHCADCGNSPAGREDNSTEKAAQPQG
jgi:hypothetical protein